MGSERREGRGGHRTARGGAEDERRNAREKKRGGRARGRTSRCTALSLQRSSYDANDSAARAAVSVAADATVRQSRIGVGETIERRGLSGGLDDAIRIGLVAPNPRRGESERVRPRGDFERGRDGEVEPERGRDGEHGRWAPRSGEIERAPVQLRSVANEVDGRTPEHRRCSRSSTSVGWM